MYLIWKGPVPHFKIWLGWLRVWPVQVSFSRMKGISLPKSGLNQLFQYINFNFFRHCVFFYLSSMVTPNINCDDLQVDIKFKFSWIKNLIFVHLTSEVKTRNTFCKTLKNVKSSVSLFHLCLDYGPSRYATSWVKKFNIMTMHWLQKILTLKI